MVVKKVLVDFTVFTGEFQGSRTYLREIYKRLVELRPDLHFVFALHGDMIEEDKNCFNRTNVEFVQLQSSGFTRYIKDFPRIVRRLNVDIIHTQYFIPFSRARKIVTIHDVLFLSFPQYFSLPFILTRAIGYCCSYLFADEVLTVSGYSKGEMKRFFRINKDVIISPCGVDESYFQKKNLSRRVDSLVILGRLEPRKGVIEVLNSDLINAYEQVYVVGRNMNMKELGQVFHPKVVFEENLSDEQVKHLLWECKDFIFNSYCEGFGIPPLEAAIAGCNVWCRNNTAMKDFEKFGIRMYDDLEEIRPLENINIDVHAILAEYNWEVAMNRLNNIL